MTKTANETALPLKALTEELFLTGDLCDTGLAALISSEDEETRSRLAARARETTVANYGADVYLRGLIEFSSYCRNDCFYCGLRRSNAAARRYRLSKDEILDCCRRGYALDFRTFVLQSGEDEYYTDELLCDIISSIRGEFPDCAVTLSIGEKERASYEKYFRAGAERYLLREETGSPQHYARLHPPELSLEHRLNCLRELKGIGYQVGCGFMVGSPRQTPKDIVCDLRFFQELQPQMIGIGPFISHKDTPFAACRNGTAAMTLRLISILRLMFPKALIPATTALGTISPCGREEGLMAGANVVMPNLSPVVVRAKYLLYDGKICTGDEAAECRCCMQRRIESVGRRVSVSRGDHPDFTCRQRIKKAAPESSRAAS